MVLCNVLNQGSEMRITQKLPIADDDPVSLAITVTLNDIGCVLPINKRVTFNIPTDSNMVYSENSNSTHVTRI